MNITMKDQDSYINNKKRIKNNERNFFDSSLSFYIR